MEEQLWIGMLMLVLMVSSLLEWAMERLSARCRSSTKRAVMLSYRQIGTNVYNTSSMVKRDRPGNAASQSTRGVQKRRAAA